MVRMVFCEVFQKYKKLFFNHFTLFTFLFFTPMILFHITPNAWSLTTRSDLYFIRTIAIKCCKDSYLLGSLGCSLNIFAMSEVRLG